MHAKSPMRSSTLIWRTSFNPAPCSRFPFSFSPTPSSHLLRNFCALAEALSAGQETRATAGWEAGATTLPAPYSLFPILFSLFPALTHSFPDHFARRGRLFPAGGRSTRGPRCRRSSWGRHRAFWRPRLRGWACRAPSWLDAVAVGEEGLVAEHGVEQQALVAVGGGLAEGGLVVEVHVDRADGHLRRGGHLGAEAQRDALVGLDADGEQVGLDVAAGAVPWPCR